MTSMENWFAEHWFDLIQSIGIVGGLVFTAETARQDTQSREISNLIAVNERYNEIWQELFRRPNLSRILKTDVDLDKVPVTAEEQLFVKMLILHLDTVRRAMNAGVFVKIAELKSDIREFLSLPIPKMVWRKMKPFQDKEFVDFVEGSFK
jgi:hypothetical protein